MRSQHYCCPPSPRTHNNTSENCCTSTALALAIHCGLPILTPPIVHARASRSPEVVPESIPLLFASVHGLAPVPSALHSVALPHKKITLNESPTLGLVAAQEIACGEVSRHLSGQIGTSTCVGQLIEALPPGLKSATFRLTSRDSTGSIHDHSDGLDIFLCASRQRHFNTSFYKQASICCCYPGQRAHRRACFRLHRFSKKLGRRR